MKFFKSRNLGTAEQQVEDLRAQSQKFKLPEVNPRIFYMGKGAAFLLLGALNFYVFHHAISGWFGYVIGICALVTELTALSLWQMAHLCVGWHKFTVISFALSFTGFSIFHALVGYLTLRGYDFPWMEFYSGWIAFPVMIVLWIACVIGTPLVHPIAAVIADRVRQETAIAIEQQKTLALDGRIRQEALQTRLHLASKQDEAELGEDVLKVARDVAQGRLESRSFADSINDPEIRKEITDILGLEDRGPKDPFTSDSSKTTPIWKN